MTERDFAWTTIASPASNRARVASYRAKRRRIDYTPSANVLDIIEARLTRGLENCAAGVIDRLVLADHEAITGKTSHVKAMPRS